MTEAKSQKLKEYFTTVTRHDHLEASDLSGGIHIYNDQSPASKKSSRNGLSPIRINDTNRSKIVLGDNIGLRIEDLKQKLDHDNSRQNRMRSFT